MVSDEKGDILPVVLTAEGVESRPVSDFLK